MALGVVALAAYQLCYADLFETFVINASFDI